jgi:hypothetical protein
VKETKRQGRIAHHHADATVPHIVALLGFFEKGFFVSFVLLDVRHFFIYKTFGDFKKIA